MLEGLPGGPAHSNFARAIGGEAKIVMVTGEFGGLDAGGACGQLGSQHAAVTGEGAAAPLVPSMARTIARRCAPSRDIATRAGTLDLWVSGREVGQFDLPPTFAAFSCSPPSRPSRSHLEAMSADTLLTPNARAGSVETHEPGSDLQFYFVAGAEFEPATSGL